MKELFRQAITILFARGFIRMAQIIAFLLLGRFLTPAEFGWFGIVTTGIALATLLGSLGLRQSVAFQIGRKLMTVGEGTATVLVLWPLLSLLAGLAVFWIYGRNVPGLSDLETAAAIILGVAGSMLVMLLQGVFLGRGEVNQFSLTETMPRVLLAIFSVILAVMGWVTLSHALWAQIAGLVLVMPVALWLAVKGVSGLKPRLGRVRPMLGYGIAFAVNLFLLTLCSRLSMFVIERISGAEQAGQFFAAVRVNDIFLEAATAFGLVLFSNSVRVSEDSNIPGRNARIACWIFWCFSVLALFTSLMAPLILKVLLGHQYQNAGTALQILAISLGPAAACKIIYPTIAGQGRPLFGAPVIAVSLIANLSLALILVPKIGVNGGSFALVAGQYILYIGYAISCKKLFKVPFRDFFIPRLNDVRGVTTAIGHMAGRLKLRFAH